MVKRLNLPAEVRRGIILDAAVKVAHRDGLHEVNADSVAKECEIETKRYSVKQYFPNRNVLWTATVEHDRTDALVEQAKTLGVL